MRIAIIGLGRMGHALADRSLEEGHEVGVWNRTPGRAGALQKRVSSSSGSSSTSPDQSIESNYGSLSGRWNGPKSLL